jgi:hypothetical protein
MALASSHTLACDIDRLAFVFVAIMIMRNPSPLELPQWSCFIQSAVFYSASRNASYRICVTLLA